MTEYNTSATFDVWEVVTARLKDVGFPTAAGAPDAPSVWFGDPDQPQPDEHGNVPMALERIVVVGIVDTPSVDWGAIGQLAREEVWRFPIVVVTALEGMTSTQARDRLRDLTRLIELDVHAIQAAAKTDIYDPPEWHKYPRWSVAVESVKSAIYGGPSGYVGQAEVVIGCSFRTNTPPRSAT